MQVDGRKLRISMIGMVNGELVSSYAADAWQEEDGAVIVSGLWGGLIPFSKEDHKLMAEAAGVSSLEWLYRRLLTCPLVTLEISQ